MHIPDGYLSPASCAALGAGAFPFLVRAIFWMRKNLKRAALPLLAMGAAFSFVIMMFNVPLPGGTTGHAVGGVLIAALLGPWAATVAVSLVLVLQAFLFGDGGILALGANILNMAVVLPFVGYWVYRAVAGRSGVSSLRRAVAAGLGGYVGINVAAFVAAVEFGLQPLLFHDASGAPLYCPYGLEIAIPAMTISHLAVAGVVEALVTGAVFWFVAKNFPHLVQGVKE